MLRFIKELNLKKVIKILKSSFFELGNMEYEIKSSH
jgi:hypothetical protein